MPDLHYTIDEALDFLTTLLTICDRHCRAASVSIHLRPECMPEVVLLDTPCTDSAFHAEVSDACTEHQFYRIHSQLHGRIWEYRFTALPELNYLMS